MACGGKAKKMACGGKVKKMSIGGEAKSTSLKESLKKNIQLMADNAVKNRAKRKEHIQNKRVGMPMPRQLKGIAKPR